MILNDKKILEEIQNMQDHMDKCNDIHNRCISELQREINFLNDFEIDGIKKKVCNDIEYKLIKLDKDMSYTIITLSVIAGILICINIYLLIH